jgi:phosphoglycolate phosphatase
LDNHTTSTLIDLARQSAAYTKEIDMQVWELAAVHEQRGMVGADLEPEAKELLQFLQGRVILTLLTNNALAAAQQALEETGIRHYFSSLAGREQMSALKPSPSGFHYLLGAYPQIPLDSWLSVGDSWIDGQAAQEAGIAFLAYRAKCADLESRGIQAMGYLTELGEIIKYLE